MLRPVPRACKSARSYPGEATLLRRSRRPIHFAAINGEVEVMNRLLRGRSVTFRRLVSRRDRYGCTPLHLAASKGHVHIVRTLVAHDADIKSADDYLATPIDYATKYGHWEVVALLLQEGRRQWLDDQSDSQTDDSPDLKNAPVVSNEEILSTLRGKPNIRVRDLAKPVTPLQLAAAVGAKDVMLRLIQEQGTNVDACQKNATPTPLSYAAALGHEDVVSFLIPQGAGVNPLDPDTRGYTELHLACEEGDIQKVNAILGQSTADINTKGLRNRTPLHIASQKGRYKVVKILLAHGADLHAETAFGSSPLELARRWEHTGDTYEETVSVLEEAWKNEKEGQART